MKKILIVEDETIAALDIKATLTKLNYHVVNCVTNYDDAISSFYKYEPDLIMMDINLKNSKDGIETATDIKKVKDIPIVFLTAYSDDETLSRAMKVNPANYMLKPYKRKQLKSTLELAFFQAEQNKKHEMTLNDMLKKEIAFYELNPIDEEYKDNELYLLKRYINSLKTNGDKIQKLMIEIYEND